MRRLLVHIAVNNLAESMCLRRTYQRRPLASRWTFHSGGVAHSAMNIAAASTVLVVEDEEKLARLLEDYLANAGFVTHSLAAGLGQGPGKQMGGRGGPNVDWMAVTLNLTDEQKANLETIRQEQMEKRRALREETQNRVAAVLTAEQREKWAEMKQLRKERRGGRGPCMGQGPGYQQ